MNDALAMLSSLSLSERKGRQQRRSCTPVLFESEDMQNDILGGSRVGETLMYISKMITQRIFDTIVNKIPGLGIVQPSAEYLRKCSSPAKMISPSKEKPKDYLDAEEAMLQSRTRKQIDSYAETIYIQRCKVMDMHRELAFTKSYLSLVCMKERNARLLEEVLQSKETMCSLHRLQDAYDVYVVTLEPPTGFHCSTAEHGTTCECYKDFDDYADFSCVSECLDTELDNISCKDMTDLSPLTAISIFYLKLGSAFESEAVEDAKQVFMEGKDFLLSIWEKLVMKHLKTMLPVDLVYILFLLENLNVLDGHNSFQSLLTSLIARIHTVKLDICALQGECSQNDCSNVENGEISVMEDNKV